MGHSISHREVQRTREAVELCAEPVYLDDRKYLGLAQQGAYIGGNVSASAP